MSDKFLIIDGSSLVHRAFYALPLTMMNSAGQYTNSVYGFTTMLIKLIADIKPKFAVVAFDKSRVTFRTELYAEYKATRKATPSELSGQFPLVRDVVRAFGIAALEEAGYEADDIIGTLAACGEKRGWLPLIVTGDRDALQLVNDKTTVLFTKKGISDMEAVNQAGLKEKYGVTPAQFVDLKALMGDKSDNIPGVSGIGEKTAIKLINEFSSVENLLDNLDKLPNGKIKETLSKNSDSARLSKKLAAIDCNMAIDFNEDDFRIKPDINAIKELFKELEFNSLSAKIDKFSEGELAAEEEVLLPEANIISDFAAVKNIIDEARSAGKLILFPLMTGAPPEITFEGAAVVSKGEAVYIPAASKGWGEVLGALGDKNIKIITYDAKRLAGALLSLGLELTALDFDASLAAYLLEPTARDYPLGVLGQKYLAMPLFKEEKIEPDAKFAAFSANITAGLYEVLPAKIAEKSLEKLYYEIELPLVEVLAALEFTGIKIDAKKLAAMSKTLAEKVEALLTDIYRLAGEEFKVNSTKQLGYILFEKLKLPTQKKTKMGYSTDAEVLEKLTGYHEIIDKIIEYRLITKLKSTYLDGLAPLINKKTGRIHTSFNQTVTATGRLSSSEPNLQNIPVRTEAGKKIRELFVPDAPYSALLSADYSQIELRVLAHMSGDARLIGAFRQNKDIHTATAAEVAGVDESQVTKEMRSGAKAVNFGIVYGISDYGLARDLGVSRKEAGDYIDNYFERYKKVKEYIDGIVDEAKSCGYVTTLFGRRRFLPEINSANFNLRSFAERAAMNTPIQGTAADIIKKAMTAVFLKLKESGLKSRLLLQVHDELVFEVADGEADKVAALAAESMQNVAELTVDLTTDVRIGINWAETK